MAPLAETATPVPREQVEPPEDLGEATSILIQTIEGMVEGLLRSVPLIVVAVVILAAGLLLARALANLTGRAIGRSGADAVVRNLGQRLVKLLAVLAAVLLALAVAGVEIGTVLAGLGIAGLAIALAVQSILENFVAGIILILRKPIRHGEQAIIGDHEGTVDDIDLRVTRLVDYDGEQIIIPNSQVFSSTIVNLTRRGQRRSRVTIGIDFRDDHDAAGAVFVAAASTVPGVLDLPAPVALCTGLGESSVDFEVRYWTAPDNRSVAAARDGVVRALKTAAKDAGFTIPWPMRTLVFDDASDRNAVDPSP